MNHIAETTKSTIGIIQAHALLAKALSNDSKPTPGYLFPEIARKDKRKAKTFLFFIVLVGTPNPFLTLIISQTLLFQNSQTHQ